MERTLLYKSARRVSDIFVPPVFAVFIFFYFAFSIESSFLHAAILIAVTVIFGFVSHVAVFMYLRRRGKLVDVDASVKEERTTPFIIAILFYTIGLAILIIFNVSPVSTAFWFCYISNTFFILIINKYWKISAHAMGAAGPFAALLYVAGAYALIFLPLLIFLGWSRVYLKCHTTAQVLAGAALGFFSSYLQIVYIVNTFYGG